MGQIVVNHKDGTKLLLYSRENVSAPTKVEQRTTLLGEDTVSMTVVSAVALDFSIGDTVDVFGKTYTLNQLPSVTKTAERELEYGLTFEGPQYELVDSSFLLPDDTVMDSFTGNLQEFLGFVVSNANRTNAGRWAAGTCPSDTEYKTLTYSDTNCLDVLQRICDEWDTEFDITSDGGVNTINLRKAGSEFPLTFKYGRTGGAYKLTRSNVSSTNIVTRAFVYGGSDNIPNAYMTERGSKKLCLPGTTKNTSYVENADAQALYGVKEGTKTLDDVYPNRYGKVTAVGSAYNEFYDDTMDFDLNEKDEEGNTKWLISGTSAKVHFNTGNLAGYEFDVHSYDHTTKKLVLVPFTDENGYTFPNPDSAAFQIGQDDVYFFIDIRLPQSYIDAAESELKEKADEYIAEYSQPKCTYSLELSEEIISKYSGEHSVENVFQVGDYIHIVDSALGVDKSIRVTSFTRNVLRPNAYTLTLSDSVTASTITRVISELNTVNTVIRMNDLSDPARARRNWRTQQEALSMVFDTEGNYYTDKIRPKSIETTYLSVGAASRQFTLQGTLIEPNYHSDVSLVNVTGGVLNHYGIMEDGTVRSWSLADGQATSLEDDKAYYIYARCAAGEGETGGTVVFDNDQHTASEGAWYYFLIGTLSSVQTDEDGSNGARFISLSYGASTVTGRFITTGRIQSGDGMVYMDLDDGEIGGNIKFKSTSGEEKSVATEIEGMDYIKESLNQGTTEIDGGLVLTDHIKVKDRDGNVTGGFSGNAETPSEDVAIWAGGADEDTAPFRVKHDGSMVATNADITGKVTSSEGKIGGFEIGANRIGYDNGIGSYSSGSGLSLYNDMILFQKVNHLAGLGLNVMPSSSSMEAMVRLEKYAYVNRNIGAYLSMTGGVSGNDAIRVAAGNIINAGGFSASLAFGSYSGDTGGVTTLAYHNTVVLYVKSGASGAYFSFPTINALRTQLGVSASTAFFAEVTFIVPPSDSSDDTVTVFGRTTEVSGHNTDNYPYIYAANTLAQKVITKTATAFKMIIGHNGTSYAAYSVG